MGSEMCIRDRDGTSRVACFRRPVPQLKTMGSDRRQAVLLDSFAGEMENVVRPLKAIFVQCHISSNIAGSYIYYLPVVNGGHAHLHRLMFLSGGFDAPLAQIESRCRLDMQPTPRPLQPLCGQSLLKEGFLSKCYSGCMVFGRSRIWSAIRLWGELCI